MEMQRKIMARGDRDRLSDLPDPILLDILSLLPEGKAVVRTSVLSRRWRFLWKSVTVSLDFEFPRCSSRKETLDRMTSINRELHHWSKICLQQRNVASLVTAVLGLEFGQRNLKEECSYLKELLHSVAHVDNLELSPWCIECLSILELEGWQPPLSSRKFLKLNTALEQLDLPGFCSFLQSSLDLETLVIDWSNYGSRHQYVLPWYKNKDEQCKRFEKIHNFNCSLLHLKTIKFINMAGPLSENKFVLLLIKYLLENVTVPEKFIIAVGCKGYVSQDCVKMEQELLSFPRSSPHASVVFSYGPSLY